MAHTGGGTKAPFAMLLIGPIFIAAAVFAFVVADHPLDYAAGTALVLVGIGSTVYGWKRYQRTGRFWRE